MKKTITAVFTAAADIIENGIPKAHAADVEFSYTVNGVSVVTRDNLSTPRRTQALAHVMNAFKAAGWTFEPGAGVALTAPDAVYRKTTKKKAAAPAPAEPTGDADTLFPAQEAPVLAFSG
ncbi:hypothetical protein ABT093_19595 [Kitasatospora sp. NPDC002551]|uniref:hypothetical protein n=1 Tax=Kitasatospora sp. NPDC002551 TaxID=3154539 RepID=UPI003332D490